MLSKGNATKIEENPTEAIDNKTIGTSVKFKLSFRFVPASHILSSSFELSAQLYSKFLSRAPPNIKPITFTL